jgi:hypothetical protein
MSSTRGKRLTISEIALREGIPKRTVLWNAQMGYLKAERIGAQGIYLVTERDLAAWLAGRVEVDELPIYVKEN